MAECVAGDTTEGVSVGEIDKELWAKIRAGDLKAREQLILDSYGLVQRLAKKQARTLPLHVSEDDIVSFGVLGLIRAIENYDPESNVYFESYAAASIRSLILDELRSLDWAPRSLRKTQREIERSRDKLSKSLERNPTDAEIAQDIGKTTEEVASTMRRAEASHHKSLDEGDAERDTYASTKDEPNPDTNTTSPRIVDIIRELPLEEQLVLVLRYYHGMKLAEVGERMGISESKASQIHTRAVMALRAALKRLIEPEDGAA